MTPDITRRAPRYSRLGLYGVLALTFAALSWPTSAYAQAWTLTTEQRQAFLQYYAPVLLKRGNGDDGRHGYDWVTSFDFDRDGNFSNNKLNWKRIPQYVDASRAGPSAYDAWRIRPTLYTSLIEFMDGSKNLKLIYHVYHALDKNAAGDYQLHDWERVEMLVTNAVGAPGSGESVAYAVVTQHKRNVVRRAGHVDLNFMQTATGKHLLIWQAEWSDKLAAAHGQELRFVTDPYAFFAGRMASAGKAEAGVNNDGGRKNVHYAFVPEGSADAVAAFGARALTYATADALASRYDNGKTITWPNVKRVTYELQDLADILPTHWQHGGYATHWLDTGPIDFYLESALVNEGGATEVSAGMQRFFPKTRDVENDDDREGYIAKKWFVGTYEMNDSASDFGGGGSNAFHDNAYASTAVDSRGQTRASASGYTTSPSSFWWQHDYFVHAGFTDSTDGVEQGFWLPGAWYLPANGGFDGRWVQLFDDRPGLESGQR
ncbi:hypothetical protein K8640_11395 [Myxococcus sp. XM-1-1-1]|uniref:hypothetical protein n=1 Tax=Myxococcus sp. XM-1-1-1 TaxID=2874602 RepID=UPI001CBB5515|nr:hypothetical protein [Myxococcus sp. XM-1-1-1]MBZ4408820.1 hypothetical protein [Myxococcus sp. XM-1-1-1]